jgi:hypothetical protein
MPTVLSPEAFNHPQYEASIQTGMKVIGNFVELDESSKVLDWFLAHKKLTHAGEWENMYSNMFRCNVYTDEEQHVKNENNISDAIWRYIDFPQMILDDWKYGSRRDCIDDTYMVIKQGEKYVVIEEVEVSKNITIEEWFKTKDHPAKDRIYIIHQT